MTNDIMVSRTLKAYRVLPVAKLSDRPSAPEFPSSEALPASITRAASKQTYYTIRFLVDRGRVTDAYRAYGYFRWVDDRLDGTTCMEDERMAFASRQQALIDEGYRGVWPRDLTVEERMLADLIHSDTEPDSGLQSYIHNLMAVMTFDASRRGRLVSQRELDEYSRLLATAVTEALHYFIGHDDPSPRSPERYLAVTGAHITHMLRDTFEDVAAGYFNISREFVEAYGIDPHDVNSDAYRVWVESRVQLARACFTTGRDYLSQVKNLRCRMAGYAYMARFEGVLDAIAREGYRLRPDYPERKSLSALLKMGWSMLTGSLGITGVQQPVLS